MTLHRMRTYILICVLACSLASCAATPGSDNAYTLYLVRHAEKMSNGSRDPLLTNSGIRRAQHLTDWFKDKDIEAIWSSDFNRTRGTAEPMLSQSGLELKIYDPGKLVSLSENLLKNQHNAIVVGHSNTTPELARLLCLCVIDDMDDSEYDRLIVISISGGETKVKILQQDALFKSREPVR